MCAYISKILVSCQKVCDITYSHHALDMPFVIIVVQNTLPTTPTISPHDPPYEDGYSIHWTPNMASAHPLYTILSADCEPYRGRDPSQPNTLARIVTLQ